MNKSKADDERLYKRTRKWAIERRGGDSRLSNLACLCRECHNMAHGSYHEEVYETLKEKIR